RDTVRSTDKINKAFKDNTKVLECSQGY
ncbi:hypothetical protein LCGC14_1844560, partial [marine sediment metagenome]